MKAVVCQRGELRVEDRPEPTPEKGQTLIKVLRCGICGSDLHLRQHCNHMSKLVNRLGYPHFPTAEDEVVFGHEFCGEVLEHAKGNRKAIKVGTRVCAVPMLRRGKEHIDLVGLSQYAAGAYAERMVVQEGLMEPIPNGLPSEHAALTEPMAVGLHAVNKSGIKKSDVAVVVGCGPVGLAVIAMLKAKGVRTVVASDFSAGRRALAQKMGADVVINPAEHSPFKDWKEYGFFGELPGLLELAVATREKMALLPGWWNAWRLAEKAGLGPKRPVVFECVGVPGILQHLLEGAPIMSRIVVVGVCMEMDKLEPAMAVNKEIEMRFVLGYTPLEFRDALHMLAEGVVKVGPMITGTVGLDGVAHAFEALGNPEVHAKILIDPSLPDTVRPD